MGMKKEDTEFTDSELVVSAVNDQMRELNRLAKSTTVPMKTFVDLLIWEANMTKAAWIRDMEKLKKTGSTFENRRWCGMPYDEFEIPSLGLYKTSRG